ncbi:hypothetical protein ACW7G2_08390 [Luteimonas sp. A277]
MAFPALPCFRRQRSQSPLENLEALMDVRFVMKDGTVFKHADAP